MVKWIQGFEASDSCYFNFYETCINYKIPDNKEEHDVDSHSKEKHSTGEEKNNDLSTMVV